MSVFSRLVNWEHIHNDSKASPHISSINQYFKKNLKVEDEVISSRKNNWKYKLVMIQRFDIEKETTEDILANKGRYYDIPKKHDSMKQFSDFPEEPFHKSDIDYLSLDDHAEKEYNQPDDWDEASDKNY